MTIVFASANKKKVAEIHALLPPGFEVLGLTDIGITDDIPEPGETIRENSWLKAAYVSEFLKQQGKDPLPVFADDSGLEVVALGAAPGVYSARYAGIPKDDAKNNRKLLEDMRQHNDRRARFVTVITLIFSGQTHCFEGEITGTIAWEARGESGFGYDPLFVPTGYRSTFAELGTEIKNNISHRGKAVRQLVEFLTGTSS